MVQEGRAGADPGRKKKAAESRSIWLGREEKEIEYGAAVTMRTEKREQTNTSRGEKKIQLKGRGMGSAKGVRSSAEK